MGKTFPVAQNYYPISDHQLSEMATNVVGGALHLQFESPGFDACF